jgi:hypothetical protein
MSWHRLTYLYCDGSDCNDEPFSADVLSGETATEQRRYAKREGWVRVNGMDLCQLCKLRDPTEENNDE